MVTGVQTCALPICLGALQAFYEPTTPATERASLLRRFRKEGVDYVVTRADQGSLQAISWPVVEHFGRWQLRSAQP